MMRVSLRHWPLGQEAPPRDDLMPLVAPAPADAPTPPAPAPVPAAETPAAPPAATSAPVPEASPPPFMLAPSEAPPPAVVPVPSPSPAPSLFSPPAASPEGPPSFAINKTGNTRVDDFLYSPVGKAVQIGAIAASMARIFPGRYIFPFVGGLAMAFATGVIRDPRLEAKIQTLSKY